VSRTNAANYAVNPATYHRRSNNAATTERSPTNSLLPHLTRAATISPLYLLYSTSHLLPKGSGSDELCEKQAFEAS